MPYGPRVGIPRLARGWPCLERRGKIIGHLKAIDRFEDRRAAVRLRAFDDRDPGGRHAALGRQSFDSLSVRPGPRTARLAGREILLRAQVVERVCPAVDPTEAQGFLDRGHVVDRLPA